MYCTLKNYLLTVGISGDRASTIGRANAETTKPIVINIADSKQALLEPDSEYRLDIRVGIGDKQ